MKRIICLVLTAALALSPLVTSANDRRPRKKKKKKQKTEQVVNTEAQPQPVAAEPETEPLPVDTVAVEPPVEEEIQVTAEQVDSLVAAWREHQREQAFDEFFNNYINIDSMIDTGTTPDSLYAGRLRALASPIPLAYNDIVRRHITRYTDPRHGTMSRILGRAKYYFPMIEEELIKAGLPVELRAMAIIESALTPTAMSRMGAAGLWQFMPRTAKSYGLEVNSLVDERLDPIRATQAACRYLKDLYSIYHDWTLAISSYNCGPGNVNKAIARSGVKECRSFWDVYHCMLRETQGYMPAFIGATYAYAYHQQHDITPAETPVPIAVDTLQINRILHFGQIASTIDLPIETLRQLNPQYKMDIIPATVKSYTLVLPQRNVVEYIEHQQEIFAKDSMYLKEYINPVNLDKKRQQSAAGRIYIVKRGDTLGAIARRYRVSTSQLMRWNNIRDPRKLRLGQRLRIGSR